MEPLEKLKKEQVETHFEQSEETNTLAKTTISLQKAILGGMTLIFLTVIAMGMFQWNVGYTLSRALGLVPKDTLSGSQMYEQLKFEIELNHLLKGLILDDVDELNLAKGVVRFRGDGEIRGATFSKDLTRAEKTQFIMVASRLNQKNALEWVQNQPNWSDGLSKRTVNLVYQSGLTDKEFIAAKKSFMHMGKPENEVKTVSNSY
tara:strand:+ start:695 stop:1306 length:612 start_codon:yes stop_codon:yes gene_type:complete